MTILDDMTETERQSWITLIADGLVFLWFWKAMAPGWSLVPQRFSPAEAGGLFFKLVIVTIIYHAIISAVFEIRRRHDGVDEDERDIEIQSAGSRLGYTLLQLGLGAVIISALLSYVAGENYIGPVTLDTPVQFLFALVFISYVADLARHGLIVYRYRTD